MDRPKRTVKKTEAAENIAKLLVCCIFITLK